LSKDSIAITGGTVVLPDQTVQGAVLLQDGRIKAIVPAEQTDIVYAADRVIDACGMYVVPGMIDMHSDAIEKEIEPRPGSRFPMESPSPLTLRSDQLSCR
jgi:alpha-D-ribose 1-methylphosphonate 5-triphosphate diphosphatase